MVAECSELFMKLSLQYLEYEGFSDRERAFVFHESTWYFLQ